MRPYYKVAAFLGIMLLCSILQGHTWRIFTTENSDIISDNINAVVTDIDGNVWVGTTSGLSKFDGENWTSFTSDNSGLPSNHIRALAINPVTNHLWMGTNFGLARYNRFGEGESGWRAYDMFNSGLPRNTVQSVAFDSNGVVWVGTLGGGGLARFTGESWTVFTRGNSDLPNNYVRAVDVDENDKVWIGTERGLASYHQGNWRVYRAGLSPILCDYILDIEVFNGTDVAAGTQTGGMALIKEDEWINLHVGNSAMPANNVKTIVGKDHGILWAGTETSGFFKLNNMHITRYSTGTHEPVISDRIRSVTIGDEDMKWIGTDSGLMSLDIISVRGITVFPDSLILEVGKSYLLTAAVIPENATNQQVFWSSADENVATVNDTGYVSTHDTGYVTITARSQDGMHLDFCDIRVTGKVAKPTFEPQPGNYEEVIYVKIKTETDGAQIYYTLDQSEPDENAYLYQEPIKVDTTLTITAKAFKEHWEPSETIRADYNIDLAVEDDIIPIVSEPSVYPNPIGLSAEDGSYRNININFSAPAGKEAVVAIYNIKGRKVREELMVTHMTGENVFSFPAKNASGQKLVPGIYFYSVKTAGSMVTGKFSIIR